MMAQQSTPWVHVTTGLYLEEAKIGTESPHKTGVDWHPKAVGIQSILEHTPK